MSQSGSQASVFYREVAANRIVWTIRDAEGFPQPLNSEGRRAQPCWSSRARVEKIIASVPAYAAFSPVEVELTVFLHRWIPGLTKDGVLVGVNWSGERVVGYDVEPQSVAASIQRCLEAGP